MIGCASLGGKEKSAFRCHSRSIYTCSKERGEKGSSLFLIDNSISYIISIPSGFFQAAWRVNFTLTITLISCNVAGPQLQSVLLILVDERRAVRTYATTSYLSKELTSILRASWFILFFQGPLSISAGNLPNEHYRASSQHFNWRAQRAKNKENPNRRAQYFNWAALRSDGELEHRPGNIPHEHHFDVEIRKATWWKRTRRQPTPAAAFPLASSCITPNSGTRWVPIYLRLLPTTLNIWLIYNSNKCWFKLSCPSTTGSTTTTTPSTFTSHSSSNSSGKSSHSSTAPTTSGQRLKGVQERKNSSRL